MNVSDQVRDVCKFGQGAACCRYLIASRDGFECAKFTEHRLTVCYSRHRTLAAAMRRARWQAGPRWDRFLTIVRVVSAGVSLHRELRKHLARERKCREDWEKRSSVGSVDKSVDTVDDG